MVYYTGVNCETKLNFLKDGDTWAKPGVKFASKIIKIDN